MQLKGASVLVTGGGGFVGSHLVERLLQEGCRVKAFVHYNSRNEYRFLDAVDPDLKQNLEVVPGDILSLESVLKATQGAEFVFHLAALISIPYSYIHPNEVVATNVSGTANVLMAARQNGVRKLVHTSTSEVYGTAQYVPIDEKHVLQPQSPYSASKIAADNIALSFFYSYGLPVSIIRPFNQYGPRQSARAVIPAIMTQALTQPSINLGALDPTRDFTFVTDTAEAYLKIALTPDTNGHVFNIGTGHEISIGDLALKIVGLVNRKVELVSDFQRMRPGASEVRRLLCNNQKAVGALRWKPAVHLDQGLERTLRWIEKNLDLFEPAKYTV